MKITKRQLRRIIREEKRRLLETYHGDTELEPEHWDVPPNPEFGGAPCPHKVAAAIQGSGASDSDILSWIHTLTMDLTSQNESDEDVEDFSFSGDAGELPRDEVFGIGYEAGKKGF